MFFILSMQVYIIIFSLFVCFLFFFLFILVFYSRSLSSASNMGGNLTWLQMQQRKLADRREAKIRAERAPHEAKMMSELRSRVSQVTTYPEIIKSC